MTPRPRKRKLAKRLGLLAMLALAAVWGLSFPINVRYFHVDADSNLSIIQLYGGCLEYYRQPYEPGYKAPSPPLRVLSAVHVPPLSYSLRFAAYRDVSPHPLLGITYISVPLPPYALALLLLTSFLYWLDSRHVRGHCRECGYNLTGNTSGICPECGVAWRRTDVSA